ncbi:hypothetical protein CERSUDRAFT_96059 [Gelatoporia subvermispora B]|uniref:Uncharacterized protein n=1 Tax=Ceriporiopsis subvermispora (strain B) TaxID=914234 RepID=M2RAM2_CERS8|nr:hypothetical protein CERSUDRAFT_96059 [Gelatoporia subvermispora B]
MLMSLLASIILGAVSLQHFDLALAAVRNISIDDTFGDPVTGEHFVYTPPDFWNVGQDCSSCQAHPDAAQAFGGTWHDASSGFGPGNTRNATVAFNGTSLYVYCILALDDGALGNVDMTFYIDGNYAGEYYIATPANAAALTYKYSALVFHTDNLPPGNHHFTIVDGQMSENKPLILFDYVQYTTYTDAAQESSSIPELVVPSSSSAGQGPSSLSISSLEISSQSSSSQSTPLQSRVSSTNPNTNSTGTNDTTSIVIAVLFVAVLILALTLIITCCRQTRRRRDNIPQSRSTTLGESNHSHFDDVGDGIGAEIAPVFILGTGIEHDSRPELQVEAGPGFTIVNSDPDSTDMRDTLVPEVLHARTLVEEDPVEHSDVDGVSPPPSYHDAEV